MDLLVEKGVFEGASLIGVLNQVEDVRLERNKLYPLNEILLLAICATIARADDFIGMYEFGVDYLDLLRKYLPFKNGVPSHDTIARVLSLINPKQFGQVLHLWARNLVPGEIIAIDGKTLRGSHSDTHKPLHMVTAFASDMRIVLGQVKVDEKSNEITAIPELLALFLTLKGMIITIDSMGCQKSIAADIQERGGDYILGLKGNQRDLREQVQTLFELELADKKSKLKVEFFEDVDKGHGRVEVRRLWVTTDLSCVEKRSEWKGLRSLVRVESIRTIQGKTTIEVRYYISSLPAEPQRMLHAIRSHWGIENTLHWTLDVTMREDESRIRTKNAPENMAIIRRFVLNMLQPIKKANKGDSIKRMMLRAGRRPGYMEQLLKACIS